MDRLIEQKRGIKRKHIPYFIGGMFILWFAGWAVFGNHESALRVDKEKVTIEEVSQGIFHDYIRIMGNVEPLTFSQLTVQEGGKREGDSRGRGRNGEGGRGYYPAGK